MAYDIHPEARIGHVHLKVANLESAIAFFRDVLGFKIMQTSGQSAAWLSAGGYHHHIALNTWQSEGGDPPLPGHTGLFHLAILYPDRASLAQAVRKVTEAGIKVDRVCVASDVGKVIDPINFENQVQGGVVWALGHAIYSEVTYSDGMAEQTNYHAAEGMRIFQTPEIIVRGLENAEKIRGIGEPPVPPAAAALASAIFDATGVRLREMPFNKFKDFV